MEHSVINEMQEMPLLCKRIPVSWAHTQHHGHQTLLSKTQAINNMHPPTTAKQVCTFLGLVGDYRKFIKDCAKTAKPLTLLTCQRAKLEWTPTHYMAFMTLKEAIIHACILQYPNPAKKYIVYIDASDNACGAHYHRNMMESNSQLHSYLTSSPKHKGNGVPKNRKHMECIML